MKTSLHPYYQLLYFSVSGVMLCLSILAVIGLHTAAVDPATTIDATAQTAVEQVVPEEVALGKSLFWQNCAQCHAKDMKTKLTGPALAGVTQRWATYPRTDLYAWIRNSQKLIAEQHPRAVALYQEWNKSAMPANVQLTDTQIEALLAYIEYQ